MPSPPNNAWIAHVKQVRAAKSLTYKEALKAASATYQRSSVYRASIAGYSHTQNAVNDFIELLKHIKSAKDFDDILQELLSDYVENMMSSSSVATSAKYVATGTALWSVVPGFGAIAGAIATATDDAVHKMMTNTPQILCYHNLLVLLCYAKHVNFPALGELKRHVMTHAEYIEKDLRSWFKPILSLGKNTYAAAVKMPVYKKMIKHFSKKTQFVDVPLKVSYVNSSAKERNLLDFLIRQENHMNSKIKIFQYELF